MMLLENVEPISVLSDEDEVEFDWIGGRLSVLNVHVGDAILGFHADPLKLGRPSIAIYMGHHLYDSGCIEAHVFLLSDGTICYAKSLYDFSASARLSRLEDAHA